MNTMNKLNKEQLTKVLNANFKLAKKADKDLADSISYTAKQYKEDATKVTKKDLLDLLKDVAKTLGDAFITPEVTPVAEHLKKSSSKKAEASKETTEEVKKPVKKSSPKKSDKKVLTSASAKAVEMLVTFPEEVSVGDEKYSRADDIKSMDDLYKALEAGEEIVFAFWWTKRHLKQFDYFMGWLGQPKSFDNDLDLATAMYVSDEKKVAYQISMYTEAVYTILPTDFEEVDGVRVAGGIEYQIYRKK